MKEKNELHDLGRERTWEGRMELRDQTSDEWTGITQDMHEAGNRETGEANKQTKRRNRSSSYLRKSESGGKHRTSRDRETEREAQHTHNHLLHLLSIRFRRRSKDPRMQMSVPTDGHHLLPFPVRVYLCVCGGQWLHMWMMMDHVADAATGRLSPLHLTLAPQT